MLVCIYAVLRRGMGAWYFQQKSPQAIQKAIRWDPCNAEYYDALATLRHLYADNENPGEQVQLYLHATSFSPQNAHFWTDLGMAYDWAGNRNEAKRAFAQRSEEHTSELQSRLHLVCRLLLEKKKKHTVGSF